MFAALALAMAPAVAQQGTTDILPPEVVRLERVNTYNGIKTVTVGNANSHYGLSCNVNAAGCVTPEAETDYLLFNSRTRWKMPGATEFITLAFVQSWTVSYAHGENIGLVSSPGSKSSMLGMYTLDQGYEAAVVLHDGPIAYGVGMSYSDRKETWKRFFYHMIEMCAQQQGQDALVAKLSPRCLPGNDYCNLMIDAKLVGVGGLQEPRRVLLMIATDIHDQSKTLSRSVCTWPADDMQVCRDWDTGQLIGLSIKDESGTWNIAK